MRQVKQGIKNQTRLIFHVGYHSPIIFLAFRIGKDFLFQIQATICLNSSELLSFSLFPDWLTIQLLPGWFEVFIFALLLSSYWLKLVGCMVIILFLSPTRFFVHLLNFYTSLSSQRIQRIGSSGIELEFLVFLFRNSQKLVSFLPKMLGVSLDHQSMLLISASKLKNGEPGSELAFEAILEIDEIDYLYEIEPERDLDSRSRIYCEFSAINAKFNLLLEQQLLSSSSILRIASIIIMALPILTYYTNNQCNHFTFSHINVRQDHFSSGNVVYFTKIAFSSFPALSLHSPPFSLTFLLFHGS